MLNHTSKTAKSFSDREVVVMLVFFTGIAVVVVVDVVVATRSFSTMLLRSTESFAKKYSGFEAIFSNSSLFTPNPTPTVKIIMPAAVVFLASFTVFFALTDALPSVIMTRIFGTPLRAPLDAVNILRLRLSASTMFVLPPSE